MNLKEDAKTRRNKLSVILREKLRKTWTGTSDPPEQVSNRAPTEYV